MSENKTLNENITIESVSEKWDKLINSPSFKKFNIASGSDFLNGWGMSYTNNPFVQNTRLKQIKSLAEQYDRETIEKMLTNPSDSELSLRKASHYFYNTIAPIMKTTNMYADLLSYRTYANVVKINDEKSLFDEYYNVNKIIDTIVPHKTFREITLQSIIEGKRFYYLWEEPKYGLITFKDLPSDYCQIVGEFEGGWKIAFNMMYFMKAGVSVEQFPPEFKDYVEEFYDYYDKDKKKLKTPNTPKDVNAYFSNKNWYFWKTLDINKGICFGVDNSEPDVVPTFSQMFLDANELNTYKMLEQELMSIPLRQIMTATVPMQKDNKSGNYNNDTAITPELIQLYQQIIQSILPNTVDFISAPLDDFKVHTFDSVANRDSIVGNAISNFYSQGGISGLLSTTDKPNVSMVKTSQILESAFIDKVYPQYEYILNQIIKSKKFKNEFKVIIEGSRFTDNDVLASLDKDLASGHTYVLPRFLSFKKLDVTTAKETAKAIELLGIYELMKPTVSAYQQSGKVQDTKGGREEKNPEDLANPENAEQGANINREKI